MKRKHYVEGSYNKCLSCKYLGNGCDGPNTLSMTLERWCEWCRALKDIRGLTNLDVAEQTGISIKTVDRIMAGSVSKDIMRSTASDINKILVGSEGQWPCSLDFEEEAPEAVIELNQKNIELERLRATLAEIHTSYKAEIDAIRSEAQAKIDYLKGENERKDRIINKLLDRG